MYRPELLRRMGSWDVELCRVLNRACHRGLTHRVFAMASRLGDGILWYAIALLLPLLAGGEALHVSLRMVFVGIAGLLVYKVVKTKTGRRRPFVEHAGIVQGARALDYYSFPSGHTLHATSFSMILINFFPGTVWLFLPFAVAVALSRMVLGLHYPSDVLAGMSIGLTLGWLGIHLPILMLA